MAERSNPVAALGSDASLHLHRRLYTQDLVDREYSQRPAVSSYRDKVKDVFSCSFSKVFRIFSSYLPIIGVVRNYAWKNDALNDFVSGLSVSFLQMPQGLALGLLASVPPVFGLYSTFYPVLIYVILGTCRHVSMGTNALLSLLTAGIVERELGLYMSQITGRSVNPLLDSGMLNGTYDLGSMPESTTNAIPIMPVEEQEAYKVGVASAVAFISGAVLFGLGLLKLGFIASYLSTSFVGGFTTAASFHIASSQIPKMLNIKIPTHTGAGKIVKTYIDIFKNIGDSNPADVVIAAISCLFLLGVAIFVNERYRHKLRVPIPGDLIIVVVSTAVSYFADLEHYFGVAIVGRIPLGLPAPVVPDTEVMSRIVVDSIVVAILTFVLTIALAKLMAETHGYTIDPDQELVAYGVCNFVSSFFRCIATCTAPPRTMILNNIGARSTMNGVVTAAFILLILLAAGQLFEPLPVAVLAVMIVVAVKNLLLQVQSLPSIWRISRPDFSIWVITCVASIFLDLDIGIAVGVGISILTVIARSQSVFGKVGGLSTKEDLVLFGENRDGIEENQQFKIFYFPSQLFFANADRFRNEMFSKALNPLHLVPEVTQSTHQEMGGNNQYEDENSKPEIASQQADENVKYVIVECSAITYIDLAGANTLKSISCQYQMVGVTLLLAKCPAYTLNLLDRAGYFKNVDRNTVFLDVHDAVTCILNGSM